MEDVSRQGQKLRTKYFKLEQNENYNKMDSIGDIHLYLLFSIEFNNRRRLSKSPPSSL